MSLFACCGPPAAPEAHRLTQEEVKVLFQRCLKLNDGRLIVSGMFARADTVNINMRSYPKRLLQREVSRYKREHLTPGTALGELDHPSYASELFRALNLPNVSHQVLRVWWRGKELWGCIEVLPTPSGLLLWALYGRGAVLGVSSRSWASLVRGPGGACRVGDDMRLITFDFVVDPSNSGAFLAPLARRYRRRLPDQSRAVQLAHLGLGSCAMDAVPRLPAPSRVHEVLRHLRQQAAAAAEEAAAARRRQREEAAAAEEVAAARQRQQEEAAAAAEAAAAQQRQQEAEAAAAAAVAAAAEAAAARQQQQQEQQQQQGREQQQEQEVGKGDAALQGQGGVSSEQHHHHQQQQRQQQQQAEAVGEGQSDDESQEATAQRWQQSQPPQPCEEAAEGLGERRPEGQAADAGPGAEAGLHPLACGALQAPPAAAHAPGSVSVMAAAATRQHPPPQQEQQQQQQQPYKQAAAWSSGGGGGAPPAHPRKPAPRRPPAPPPPRGAAALPPLPPNAAFPGGALRVASHYKTLDDEWLPLDPNGRVLKAHLEGTAFKAHAFALSAVAQAAGRQPPAAPPGVQQRLAGRGQQQQQQQDAPGGGSAAAVGAQAPGLRRGAPGSSDSVQCAAAPRGGTPDPPAAPLLGRLAGRGQGRVEPAGGAGRASGGGGGGGGGGGPLLDPELEAAIGREAEATLQAWAALVEQWRAQVLGALL
ncbi:MAG: Prohead core protein protease-domain-containing protein [Monoraphidium minutum]|nr:MAG: Prohead core protein protease-domain-containing protein [Monoraphidium minutum]